MKCFTNRWDLFLIWDVFLRLWMWLDETLCLSHSKQPIRFLYCQLSMFVMLPIGQCLTYVTALWCAAVLLLQHPHCGHHCLQACGGFLFLSQLNSCHSYRRLLFKGRWLVHSTQACWKLEHFNMNLWDSSWDSSQQYSCLAKLKYFHCLNYRFLRFLNSNSDWSKKLRDIILKNAKEDSMSSLHHIGWSIKAWRRLSLNYVHHLQKLGWCQTAVFYDQSTFTHTWGKNYIFILAQMN